MSTEAQKKKAAKAAEEAKAAKAKKEAEEAEAAKAKKEAEEAEAAKAAEAKAEKDKADAGKISEGDAEAEAEETEVVIVNTGSMAMDICHDGAYINVPANGESEPVSVSSEDGLVKNLKRFPQLSCKPAKEDAAEDAADKENGE